MKSRGHVMEIYSAVQGEGPWLGIRQVFFRLYRCNLRCSWCDTPESFELTGAGKTENPPGSRRFAEFKNPLEAGEALKLLSPFWEFPHHSISLTGGEPLLQKEFLLELLPELHRDGRKIFLETGGSLPEILREILPHLDFISMDIKLPSSAKERPLWEKHREFLKLSAQKETYVKIVVTQNTLEEELHQALGLVQNIAPSIPVILQPVTPAGGELPPSETQMLRWHSLALAFNPGVRVIPQIHKLMSQR